MSQLVLPLPIGAYVDNREPHTTVRVDTSASEREFRSTWQTIPRWKIRIKAEVLNGIAGGRQDLQQWLGYLGRHFGMLDSFLISDPEDNAVTDHGFAVGDGVTAGWQLQRTIGGAIQDAAGFSYPTQSKPFTNMVKNSSFEASSGGLATSWTVYNSTSATEPMVTTIVPGVNGGNAQRVSWGTNSTGTKGIFQAGVSAPAWLAGQWYTISFLARASGSNVGQFIGNGWNTFPNQTVVKSCPALTGSFQRYVFQVFWNVGTSPTAEMYLSISTLNNGGVTPPATFGDLDFDDVLVVAGQYDATTLPQPFSTPAAATATRNPAYWPALGDGFEPIFDLKDPPTIYQDGDWGFGSGPGKRQLYPWARSNLLPFSEQFDNAAWAKTNITVTANSTTAPDGTTTADQINEGTATGFHFLQQNTIPAEAQGELRCYSVFVKAGTLTTGQWVLNTSGEGVGFDASAGTITSVLGAALASGVITDPRWGAGWYRFWFVKRVSATLGTGIQFVCAASSYTGTSRTINAWGAMCERVSNLSGPTPYIATPAGAAVAVTDYSVDSLGKVTPAAVLPAGAFLSADLTYYKRVRLAQPGLPLQRICTSLWASGLDLLTVIP